MCRSPSPAREGWYRVLRALALLALLMPPLTATAADMTRLLEVFVNGQPTHLLVELIDRDGRLLVRADDIVALGLAVPPTHGKPDPARLIALQDLRGLVSKIDEQRQELRLTAEDDALQVQHLDAARVPAADDRARAQTGFGAVLNYDLLATDTGSRTTVSGTFDGRAFMPWGTATSSWIAQLGLPGAPIRRLDTTLSYQDPARLERWEVGDAIAGGLDWTRPYRLGGLQFSSNFSLRPDLVTYAVPTLSGRADVPSTMDLFVDGVRTLSHDVAPGPFQLQQAPLVNGAGDLSVVVRDAAGRESVQSLNFYTSTSLLARGLSSYSVEAGLLRQGYGLDESSYAHAATSGTVRTGLTNWLTLESHAEMSAQAIMGGVGSTFSVAGLALGSVSVAASNPSAYELGQRATGLQYSVGLQRIGRRFSISASTTRTTPSFQDVSTTRFNPLPRRLDRLQLGLSFGSFGTIGVTYAAQSGGYALDEQPGSTASDTRIISASYTRPIANRLQLYVTAYRDLVGTADTGITLGLVIPIGRRSSASATAGIEQNRPIESVQFQQAAVAPGDIGLSGLASDGVNAHQTGQVTYVSGMGTASAAIDRAAGQTGVRGEIAGALVAVPQGAFVANRINDSFAVVDTDGLPGVTVDQENRPIGRTGADGLLLVPNLNGWQTNRISLDPADLPPDADIGSLQRQVVPRGLSGVHVSFDVKQGHSALIRLVDEKGVPLRVGSMAVLLGDGLQSPVGFDGEVFFTRLHPTDRIQVTIGAARCISTIRFAPRRGELPVIGPVPCLREAAR